MGCFDLAKKKKKRPRPQAINQYAYSAHRRHLHAVLAVRLQLWRLRSQSRHALAVFFDQTNAFPSMAWSQLDLASDLETEVLDAPLLSLLFIVRYVWYVTQKANA